LTAGRQVNTQSQEWCTPTKYIEAINKFFNHKIELDPCSNPYSIVNAEVKYELPIDGLKQDWNYYNIYINPHLNFVLMVVKIIKDVLWLVAWCIGVKIIINLKKFLVNLEQLLS